MRTSSRWQGALTLSFAEVSGECGSLGRLSYEPETGTLGSFSCVVARREVTDCSVDEELECEHESGLRLGVQLVLTASSTGGWRGRGFVELDSSEQMCSGEYNVHAG